MTNNPFYAGVSQSAESLLAKQDVVDSTSITRSWNLLSLHLTTLKDRQMSDDLMTLGELRPAGRNSSLVVPEKKKSDLVPHMMGAKGLVQKSVGGTVLQVKKREIIIDEVAYEADPHDLIAMIRTITQDIGSYKKQDNLLSKYMMAALRKARAAMVSDLQKFGIHWEIDKQTQESIFWM